MDTPVAAVRRAETEAHVRLKRLALLWAQANRYSACAAEVTLPQCRYRADVAAYRSRLREQNVTAIFECKQALPDLRRDNCETAGARERLRSLARRREILEKHLRVHYPTLRTGDSLFAEYDSHDFDAIGHRGYRRVLRESTALENRLFGGTKFECLVRYRCANLFFLVLPNELFQRAEAPIGWGVLVETENALEMIRKPVWHDNTEQARLRLLQRIAMAGTRQFNRAFGITREQIVAMDEFAGSGFCDQ
ncbi:MAG TPA: hypothetical protein VH252_00615 [Chthoniobacterales bacterium]|jgi:hypothetical protein|nr:hypothetical protein [Chthoniobacterales bacterium]